MIGSLAWARPPLFRFECFHSAREFDRSILRVVVLIVYSGMDIQECNLCIKKIDKPYERFLVLSDIQTKQRICLYKAIRVYCINSCNHAKPKPRICSLLRRPIFFDVKVGLRRKLCNTMPFHVIPCYSMLSCAMVSYIARLCGIVWNGIPKHTTYHTTPYHTIPHNTMPHNTIPHRTIPNHSIPYSSVVIYRIVPRRLQRGN